MKLLKLDARFEDARRVARCLVGSKTKQNDLFVCVVPHQQFSDLFSFYVIDRIMEGQDHELQSEMRHECGWNEAVGYSEITLPINTLNFCPYLAAKHQVQVRGFQKGILQFGVIKKIAIAKAGPRFRIDSIEGHAMMFRKSSISVNLTPIERGELEGCEIVEAKA